MIDFYRSIYVKVVVKALAFNEFSKFENWLKVKNFQNSRKRNDVTMIEFVLVNKKGKKKAVPIKELCKDGDIKLKDLVIYASNHGYKLKIGSKKID